MDIKKVLKESLENYGDSVVFKDKTKKEVYGTGFCIKNNDKSFGDSVYKQLLEIKRK